MGFPNVIVECAFNSILDETTSAPTGFTDITKYVDTISGTLRGRSYELDDIETGSITLSLDNSDGRFTPGSPLSPYYPYVKANRRLRIRGKNLQRLNIARTGGQEGNANGFFVPTFNTSDAGGVKVTSPVVVTHNPVSFGFTGDLLKENTHIEGTLKAGALAGTYRVLSWWAPIELGARMSHRAYVWRVSGTEPASTTIRIGHTYFDSDGTALPKIDTDYSPSWSSPMASTPQGVSYTDLPNGDTAYALQSIVITLTATATTDITYAVAGIQAEFNPANLSPGISGWYDASVWSTDGSGTAVKAGASVGAAYLLVTWAADDTEASITVPHLMPGEDYTFVIEAQKSGGPDVLVTADDGLTGDTLSANTVWQTMRTTFTATRAEQTLKFQPQGTVIAGQTLWLRLARVAAADPALTLASFAGTSDVTAWERPIPVFDGWVERWPIKTTAQASTITITVNDRLKKLGEVVMESTLKQTLVTHDPALLIPFTDDPIDSGSKVSMQGDWADASDSSGLEPTQTKYGAGASTFTLGGTIGPTGEDALTLVQVSATQGNVLYLPYSADYVTPAPPVTTTPKPVPAPPVVTTYKKTYYATWSRAYDGSNATRYDDPPRLYQGASLESGDTNGNQRSLIGFNWNAINADLKGASVLGATVTMYAQHWWYYAGGTAYLGFHTHTSKPSTFSSSTSRKWKQTKWPRSAWRTVNIGAAGGVLFQKGTAKGISVGWGDNDHETYGYFAGATTSQRPYLTITYKK